MKFPILAFVFSFSFLPFAFSKTWQVGPTRTYTYCSKVAALVQNGDTILIDFATYLNDPQVKWDKNNLLIKGVGGRPRLEAGSIIANDASNGKGIFVISGANVRVENIEFANAAVIDRNGAGIRQEGANLYIHKCKFIGNEMGILCGNIANCKTTVEFSEFFHGGSSLNPGYQHNIYINHIDTFVFRYNFSHDAIAEGHELKSRATYNFILYNRIANEQSTDSRTIDLPNGGTTVIVGNIIEQGPNSANSNLLGYGLEGLSNPAPHKIWICNNTFINKKSTGSFIHTQSGTDTLFVKNNILAGAKTGGLFLGSAAVVDSSNNLVSNNIADFGFVDATKYNYQLLTTSIAKDAGIEVNKSVNGYDLQPKWMYKDTCNVEIRNKYNKIDIGAFEFFAPTGSKELANPTFTIFPNPTEDWVHLELKNAELKQVKIYSLSGEFLQTFFTSDFSIAPFQNGVYFLLIQTEQQSFCTKIMKF